LCGKCAAQRHILSLTDNFRIVKVREYFFGPKNAPKKSPSFPCQRYQMKYFVAGFSISTVAGFSIDKNI
jgi:hypothetical protein